MVFAPVVSTFVVLLLMLFLNFRRKFLPGFVLVLFDTIALVFLVLVFLTLLLLVTFSRQGTELGRQLELPLEFVDGGCQSHDLVIFKGFGSPSTLVLQVVEL